VTPVIHTQLPSNDKGHYSEYQLAKTLETFADDQLELWFSVNYIAPIGDCDLIIFHPEMGVYLCEIKGMALGDIETYDLTRLILQGNKVRQHPVAQIRDIQIRTRNYLTQFHKKVNKGARVPFLQTSVIWPSINRSDWISRFNSEQIRIQAKSMIFKDDLVSVRSLKARLKIFWESPLLGKTPLEHTRQGKHGDIDLFREAIAPTQEYEIKNESLSNELKRSVYASKELADKYPPPKRYEVSFEGPPGTGKSTILREIGLLHASGGGSVLHVCYSKVLAADQRREYQLLMKKSIEHGVIDVFDEWELYKAIHTKWEPLRKVSDINSPQDYKFAIEHVQEIIELMDTPEGFPKHRYDTILIDESQDLSEALFLLLDKLARPTASWFISYGKGQEIWSFNKENPAPWLQNWLKSADRKQLKRSFRNSTRTFLMAQNFWENYPDLNKSSGWIESKLKFQLDKQDAWELDLALPKDTNDFKTIRLSGGQNRKDSIKSVILGAIEDTRLADRGMDILISVGSEIKHLKNSSVIQSSSYSEILEILDEIAETIKIDVLDLVKVDNRRSIPKAGTIRIVRNQNLRGISASHVILFDLDLLEIWSQLLVDTGKAPIQNYGYIALSRSRASTIVAIRNDSDSNIESYIEKTLTIVRQKFLEISIASAPLS
jgi:hypothetical protein